MAHLWGSLIVNELWEGENDFELACPHSRQPMRMRDCDISQ